MHTSLKLLAILWAWACWAWVAYSHQWLWLVASLIPYLAFNVWGQLLDKDRE